MRIGMTLVFIFGGMAIYTYVQKNRVKQKKYFK